MGEQTKLTQDGGQTGFLDLQHLKLTTTLRLSPLLRLCFRFSFQLLLGSADVTEYEFARSEDNCSLWQTGQ